jgi:chromosome segregation ATPase
LSVELKTRQLAVSQAALYEMRQASSMASAAGRLETWRRSKETQLQQLQTASELRVLSRLESSEGALTAKRQGIERQKEDVIKEIRSTQDRLETMRFSVDVWQTKDSKLETEFTDLIAENKQFEKELTAVYKRGEKFRGLNSAGPSADQNPEDDFFDDFAEDDDPSAEDCPVGCDRAIFDQVLAFKERKKLLNKDLDRIQNDVETLKLEHSRLVARERVVENEIALVDAEIAQFRSLKTNQLNTHVHTVVLLHLHQLPVLSPSLPNHIKLLTHTQYTGLVRRIPQIKEETRQARQEYRSLQKEFAQKLKEEEELKKEVVRRGKELEETQIVKFGQVVDLDKIEKAHIRSPRIQEVEKDIKSVEMEIKLQMTEVEKQISSAQKKLDAVTLQNTAYIEQLTNLGRQQLAQELGVKAKLREIKIRDESPMKQQRAEEIDKINALILNQRKEIATLKSEIELFRVKGGHIYTVVTSADSVILEI